MSEPANVKPENIQIEVGETPMGTLTMATHKPRKTIKARVVREGDWRAMMAVINAADGDLGESFWEQTETNAALKRLRRLLKNRRTP